MSDLRPGVLFDVDGTLLDTNYLHVLSWWQAMNDAGHEGVSMAAIHRSIGIASEGLVERLLGHDDDKAVEAHSKRYEALRDQVERHFGPQIQVSGGTATVTFVRRYRIETVDRQRLRSRAVVGAARGRHHDGGPGRFVAVVHHPESDERAYSREGVAGADAERPQVHVRDAVGLDAEELLRPGTIDQEGLHREDGDQDKSRDAGTELCDCVHG